MNSRDIPDPQPNPARPAPTRCVPRDVISRLLGLGVLLSGLLTATGPAFAGGTYELQFIPTGPLVFAEDDNSINFQVQVVGGCTPYSVTWEPEIEHITTDFFDLGTPMPNPVGLSDIGPVVGITIPINNDPFIEGQESFFFKLTPSSMVDMNCADPPIVPSEAFYKIEIFIDDDEDDGDDHLEVKDAVAVEGSGQMLFEVERVNANLGVAASASFVLVEDSADEGVDYIYPVGTTINFPMGGPTTQVVAIDLIDDSLTEGAETFFFKLSGAANTAIGDGVAIGTILDDDNTYRLRILDLTTPEGDEERVEGVEVRVTTSDPPRAEPITVGYVAEAGSAQPGEDFLLEAGTLTFPPGNPVQHIPLRILGDTVPESDETLVIRLVNPDGAELFDAEATVTLVNDDEASGPIVAISDAEVTEGDEGGTDVSLTVSLDAPLPTPFAVAFATEDGTAVAGVDYEAAEGVLEFPAGETSAEIALTVLGDLLDEADEMFRVRLTDVPIPNTSSASRASQRRAPGGGDVGDGATANQSGAPLHKLVGDTEAVITILDDDSTGGGGDLPQMRVQNIVLTEGDEGTSPARFTVRLSEPSSSTVSAAYQTFDGSATAADSDYQPASGQVIFAPGQTEQAVEVAVVGDTRVETDETFGLRLTGADGAVIARAEATAIIVNDDEEDDDGGGPNPGTSVVRLLPTQPATEGGGPASVRVERIGSDIGPVTVLLVSGGGNATAGQDYAETRRVVEWNAGQRGVIEIPIPILDDTQQEDTESFFVRLTEAQNATIGTLSEARQEIIDNDTPMNLVAISDLEQTVLVGVELTLEARVERDDGAPVGGATVRWVSRRKVQITGPEVTVSGDDGVVRQTVRFAAQPGVARVGALLIGTDSGLEFQFRVEGDLDSTIGDRDGNDGDIADAFDFGCADEDDGDAFGEACDYLYGIDGDAQRRQALDSLSPRQALPHQRQTLRAPRNQVRNVSARLTALRGGMARSAFDQLALSIQGQGLSLSPLQSAIAGYDPSASGQDQIADRVDLALRRAAGLISEDEARERLGRGTSDPALGGAASGDDEDIDYGGESPWGMFFNGRISFGDAPRLGERPDFEFQTEGVTLGIDRRMGGNWVLGAALGYTRSETDVGSNIGHLDLTGLSLTFYSTYYTENWYVDGVLSYGENEFDVERVIDLPVTFRGLSRLTAVGSPDATQTAANVAFGYDFRLGDALTLSGFMRANWTRSEIDGYTETGALLFDLEYESQTLDSLLGEVGIELTRPFSFDWGVLQPLLRVAVLHEFDDDLDVVRARFARGRSPRTFRLEGSAIDRDFFNVAVGATATLRRGWATYFQYDTDLERDDLDLYTFSGGFRFQF